MERIPVEKITIVCEGRSAYAVIADGRVIDHLCWEEMLGYIAQLTLIGTERFHATTIGDVNHPHRYPRIAGLLNA